MKKKLSVALAAGVLVAASIAPVASFAQAGTGPNPYRDCGIGAALFPTVNWAAVTSNVIWDVGTTAVISATASPETCQGSGVQTAKFILDTYDNIVEETAQGSGEHLTAMLNILGCAAPAHAEVIGNVRSSLMTSVGSTDYIGLTKLEKSSQYYDTLMVASSACS